MVSITVTVAATLIALAVRVLAGYPLARFRLRGARVLLLVLLATMLIPPIALALPVLYLVTASDIRDSIIGLVLVNAAFWSPILIWLVRGAFIGVPPELERAARIDGCSRLGAIFRVSLPAAAPVIAAATAIVFIGIWNDFVFAAVIGGQRDAHAAALSRREPLAAVQRVRRADRARPWRPASPWSSCCGRGSWRSADPSRAGIVIGPTGARRVVGGTGFEPVTPSV